VTSMVLEQHWHIDRFGRAALVQENWKLQSWQQLGSSKGLACCRLPGLVVHTTS